MLLTNEDYKCSIVRVVTSDRSTVLTKIKNTKYFSKDIRVLCIILASLNQLSEGAFTILSISVQGINIDDVKRTVECAESSIVDASLLSETDVLNLFFNKIHVELSNGVFFLHEDRDSKIHSIGYYRSGVSATGEFVNDNPSGPTHLTFLEQNITSDVTVNNGCRLGESSFHYGNGLKVNCCIEDAAPTLWRPIIPYMRNYYNPSALGFGGSRFTISEIYWKDSKVLGTDADVLKWILTYFDVAQHSIRIDLTSDSLPNPPEGIVEWVENQEFSCVESVTLCAQQCIRRNAINYLLPTLANMTDANLYLPQMSNHLCQSFPSALIRRFNHNVEVAVKILMRSPHLKSLHLIAVPLTSIILGASSDAEGFMLSLDLVNKLMELTIEKCFTVNSLSFNGDLNLRHLVIQEVYLKHLQLTVRCGQLKVLYIERCPQMTKCCIGNQALPECGDFRIQDCHALKSIDIGEGNMLANSCVVKLLNLRSLKSLKIGSHSFQFVVEFELDLVQLEELSIGKESYQSCKLFRLLNTPSLRRMCIGDCAFQDGSLDILMPLLFLESFEVGTHCFTNTSLLIPIKFPNICRFFVDDYSFSNTRLAPITGSFMQVISPDDDYANEDVIKMKQDLIRLHMRKESLSAEEFTENLENGSANCIKLQVAFSLLKEIHIGKYCFFSTVVFVVHSILALCSQTLDTPQVESISIGEYSLHDVQTISFSYLPKLKEFDIAPHHNLSLYNLRLFHVPLLQGINYTPNKPMEFLDFPCLSNFIYFNISSDLINLATHPRLMSEKDKHPNEYYAPPNEYLGHSCHEVSEMTTNYINIQVNHYDDQQNE